MSFIPSYPYNNIENDSINFDFNQQQERIIYFDYQFDIDNPIESFEFRYDINSLETIFHYGYSLDSDNWSQFYIDFQLFKSHVNEQLAQGFETFIRIKIMVNKEDERNYDKLTNNRNIVQIQQVLFNGKKIRIDKIEIPFANNYISKKTGTNLWNPYNGMGKATSIWKSISYAINNVVGLYVYYFKVQPDMSSRSISLKSYRIKNVTDLKKIKVLIPDNDIPDNANIFSEYGINFADEMVMHLLDETFIEAFTKDGGVPSQNDFLYFPLTERMYEVNSAYPVKEFMQEIAYWKLSLVKYEQRESVKMDMDDGNELDYEQKINEWINFQDKYEEEVQSFEEIQKASPDYYNTDILEATRSVLHKDLNIIQFPLLNGSVRLFQNWYRMSLVEKGTLAVSYKARNQRADNLSISFWMLQESRSRKILFECESDLGNKWLRCEFKESKIIVTYPNGDILLESTKTLDIKKSYSICLNYSNQYSFASLIIMEYDETKKVINLYDNVTNGEIYTYNELLNSINIFGGQHLISAMTLRKRTLDDSNVKEFILTTQPNSKDVIFHDKCETVGADIKSRL